MDTDFIILMTTIAFSVGAAKGGLGSAMGGLIVPFLSIITDDVKEAVLISLPLYIVGDWLAVRAYWKTWDKQILLLTLPFAAIGVLIGTILLRDLSSEALRFVLGIMSLVIGIYNLLRHRLQHIKYSSKNWHGFVAGLFGGIGAALASAGGPAYSAYLLLQDIPPRIFIGTSAVFFMLVNLMRVPWLWKDGLFGWDTLQQAVWFMPIVWLGVLVGQRFVNYINPLVFDRIMTIFLILAGIVLLFN